MATSLTSDSTTARCAASSEARSALAASTPRRVVPQKSSSQATSPVTRTRRYDVGGNAPSATWLVLDAAVRASSSGRAARGRCRPRRGTRGSAPRARLQVAILRAAPCAPGRPASSRGRCRARPRLASESGVSVRARRRRRRRRRCRARAPRRASRRTRRALSLERAVADRRSRAGRPAPGDSSGPTAQPAASERQRAPARAVPRHRASGDAGDGSGSAAPARCRSRAPPAPRITRKKSGMKKMPIVVANSMPANTPVPSEWRLRRAGAARDHQRRARRG